MMPRKRKSRPKRDNNDGEIFVWESQSGWKVVEAWRDEDGCPYSFYVVLQDGMTYKNAIKFAKRLRETFGSK